MGAAFANKAHRHEQTGFMDFTFPTFDPHQSKEKRVFPILDEKGHLVTLVCIPIFNNSKNTPEENNTFDHLYSVN